MLSAFIRTLLDDGRLEVGLTPLAAVDDGLADALAALDQRARQDCPGTPPPMDAAVAAQAVAAMHAACRLLVFRDQVPGPPPVIAAHGASAHWSVDLAFRHLPTLWRQVRERAGEDPLLAWIAAVLQPWPLSAVGVPGAAVEPGAAVLDHPALAGEYLDRCLAAGDHARLAAPALQPALARWFGAHPHLVPAPQPSTEARP